MRVETSYAPQRAPRDEQSVRTGSLGDFSAPSIHYDIAKVVDPFVHLVAKTEKSTLAKIRP